MYHDVVRNRKTQRRQREKSENVKEVFGGSRCSRQSTRWGLQEATGGVV